MAKCVIHVDYNYVDFFQFRKNPIPSVSLGIHEQDSKTMPNDLNAHHLLEQHLYKSRRYVRIVQLTQHDSLFYMEYCLFINIWINMSAQCKNSSKSNLLQINPFLLFLSRTVPRTAAVTIKRPRIQMKCRRSSREP